MNKSETQDKAVIKTVKFEVLRYNPDGNESPHLENYSVPVTKGMTVLDGLNWIKEHLDSSLSWRSSSSCCWACIWERCI